MNFHQGFFYAVNLAHYVCTKRFTDKAFSIIHVVFFFRSYFGYQIYANLY